MRLMLRVVVMVVLGAVVSFSVWWFSAGVWPSVRSLEPLVPTPPHPEQLSGYRDPLQ